MMKGKFEIAVKGLLDQSWKSWFDGMDIHHEGDNTILTGNVNDAAHLHGILDRIRNLNLHLISVNPATEEFNNQKMILK
jgi:hypothetical protein